MASTIDQEEAARMSMKSLYTIIPVSFAAIGMQVFMCWFGTIIYTETPKALRRGRGPYIGFSWLILVLFSLSQSADAVEIFNLLLNSTSAVEALTELRPVYEFSWWRISTSMCLWICNWIGDGLLLYRLFKIWNDMQWICILPALAYIGSCGISTTALVYRIKWLQDPAIGPVQYGKALQAWIFLSVSVNCVITALISFRLLRVRNQLSTVMSPKDLEIYVGVVAILVESALPLSLAGIAFAALSTPSSSGAVTVARTVALLCWFSLNALCPQMIIFRVITGRSWIGSPTGDSASSTRNNRPLTSTRIEFTDPQLTESKTDTEMSFSSSERSRKRLSKVPEETADGNSQDGVVVVNFDRQN